MFETTKSSHPKNPYKVRTTTGNKNPGMDPEIQFYKLEQGDNTDQGNTVKITTKYNQSHEGKNINLVTQWTLPLTTMDTSL